MKIINQILLILLLISNISNISAQDKMWILKKDKDGIQIYTRVDKATGNVEFKANIIIETTINDLLSVFSNVEGYVQWMADMKTAKTLKEINETEKYIYFVAKVPWPLENRDMSLYQTIEKTENGAKIYLDGKPNYIPPIKGITRVEEASGFWELITLPNNKVQIIYQFLGDTGMNIPTWIVNLFIVDGPYETLINLKALVEK